METEMHFYPEERFRKLFRNVDS